jgi:outer membrane protein assembly factor BamB
MLNRILILAVFLIALIASGCENPSDDGSQSNTASMEWNYTFDDAPLAPVVLSSSVYVTTGKGIFAFDTDTGASVWRIDKNITSNVFAADGRVYYKSGSLTAVNADNGLQIWQTGTPYSIYGAGDGFVAIGSTGDDGSIAVYDGSNGKREWQSFGYYPSNITDIAYSSGVIAVSLNYPDYMSSENNTIFQALDISNGDILWGVHTEGKASRVWSVLYVGNGLIIADSTSYDSSILIADISNGKTMWESEEDGEWCASPSKVFLSTGSNINAYTAKTGDLNWSIRCEYKVIYADDYACYVASDAYLYAYDASNGRTLWRLTDASDGDWICNSKDNTVFAAKGKKLYAIRIK